MHWWSTRQMCDYGNQERENRWKKNAQLFCVSRLFGPQFGNWPMSCQINHITVPSYALPKTRTCSLPPPLFSTLSCTFHNLSDEQNTNPAKTGIFFPSEYRIQTCEFHICFPVREGREEDKGGSIAHELRFYWDLIHPCTNPFFFFLFCNQIYYSYYGNKMRL